MNDYFEVKSNNKDAVVIIKYVLFYSTFSNNEKI